MTDADVLVIGCGPVGVMTALRCAQRGLSVVAVDRSTEIYPLPRAIGMDDENQALFDRAGLGAQLRSCSTPIPGGDFVNAAGERVVGVELPPGTVGRLGYPPIVTFDQPSLEASLRSAAIAAGVDMRLGDEVHRVTDVENGVAVELADGTVSARWLVAADGAKSTLRDVRGIEMVDQGFDQTWLVVDTTLLDPDLPLPHLARQFCDPARVHTFVPGPGRHRRWEFQLHEHETRDESLRPEAVAEFLRPWGTPDQLRVDRTAVYRFHARVAERFRDGPVFLAGDAAHQMPPFNGQGMCTGLRDAENLSWKLAAVASGEADPALLDTYDAERRPHAEGQIAHAVDAGELMQAIAHDGPAALDSGYGQRPFPRVQGDLFEGHHPLCGKVLPAPAVEVALPDDGWLILTTCDVDVDVDPRPLGAAIVRTPDDAFPGLVDHVHDAIVRPDRHVATVTAELAASTCRLAATMAVAT